MVDDRRQELAQFLRDRRKSVERASLGLSAVSRSRTPGLRREEVAAFANVSVTWYTWLEQGRPINASRQVLNSLAGVLGLDAAEHDYLLALGGYSPLTDHEVALLPTAPAHVQRLLDALDFPAFAVAPDWRIAAWNSAYSTLYAQINSVKPSDRNLLWLIFTDPHLREMLPDWAETSRHFVAEFRAESGLRIGSAAHKLLLERLTAASSDFARIWADLDVERFSTRQRTFLHPQLGTIVFEQHRLIPSDVRELQIVAYTPRLTTVTEGL